MTFFDKHVIADKDDIPWDLLPDWVGWWAAEEWGGSWAWENEPVLQEEGYWLPDSGFTPVFAGWYDMITGEDWKTSKTRRPGTAGAELGQAPEATNAEHA